MMPKLKTMIFTRLMKRSRAFCVSERLGLNQTQQTSETTNTIITKRMVTPRSPSGIADGKTTMAKFPKIATSQKHWHFGLHCSNRKLQCHHRCKDFHHCKKGKVTTANAPSLQSRHR